MRNMWCPSLTWGNFVRNRRTMAATDLFYYMIYISYACVAIVLCSLWTQFWPGMNQRYIRLNLQTDDRNQGVHFKDQEWRQNTMLSKHIPWQTTFEIEPHHHWKRRWGEELILSQILWSAIGRSIFSHSLLWPDSFGLSLNHTSRGLNWKDEITGTTIKCKREGFVHWRDNCRTSCDHQDIDTSPIHEWLKFLPMSSYYVYGTRSISWWKWMYKDTHNTHMHGTMLCLYMVASVLSLAIISGLISMKIAFWMTIPSRRRHRHESNTTKTELEEISRRLEPRWWRRRID